MSAQPFLQQGPRLFHPWREDPWLRALAGHWLPPPVLRRYAERFERLAEVARLQMPELARQAEAQPPKHLPFDAWGRRIDRIEVAPAWQRLHEIAAQHGVVATAYDPEEGSSARLLAGILLFLYHPSSAIASCPLAMTDGAARVLLEFGSDAQRDRYLPHLLSRDPSTFWTSGQWMTERSGGSDVSGTETEAVPARGGRFLLSGIKWFCSATTAEIALALARIKSARAGSRGLSLFLIQLEGQVGRSIRVLRLKEKLGTRALPTAELELDGTVAELVGQPGRGVAQVAAMLNVTRLYNSLCAAGSLARGVALAFDYARKRRAFGQRLWDLPAHRVVLADLAAASAATTALALDLARRAGRLETGAAGEQEALVTRALTPVVKLWTAKRAVSGLTEAIEALGGAGYVEDTGLPALLRDAHVLPIWEGTTSVLALDLLRALEHDAAFEPLRAEMDSRLKSLAGAPASLVSDWTALASELSSTREPLERQARARVWAFRLGSWLERLLLAELAAQRVAGPLGQALAAHRDTLAANATADWGASPGSTSEAVLQAAEELGWWVGPEVS